MESTKQSGHAGIDGRMTKINSRVYQNWFRLLVAEEIATPKVAMQQCRFLILIKKFRQLAFPESFPECFLSLALFDPFQ